MKTVASADGTLIAYEQGGTGRISCSFMGRHGNRTRWASIRPRLRSISPSPRMDRRGCGDSGDSPEYAIEREFEDVAAIVNAVDAPVLLFGHSYGALCALEAAMRTDKLPGLVLYEPPIYEGESLTSPEQLERLETFLPPAIAKASSRHCSPRSWGVHRTRSKTSRPRPLGRAASPRHTRCRESFGRKKPIACPLTASASCRYLSCFSSAATARPSCGRQTPS